MSNSSLSIAQQALSVLAKWAGTEPPEISPENNEAIKRAKKILSWRDTDNPKPLSLLFDDVYLSSGQQVKHYCPVTRLGNKYAQIPYPQTKIPDNFDLLQKQIRHTLNRLHREDWQNLSLIMILLEKFGSFLSFGDRNIALIDMVRSTSAVATALGKNPDSKAKDLSLVAGSISKIQDFIYTISSDGALKSLRARSFYLELVTEEIVQRLLIKLDLPRSNVIYEGGSNLYILATSESETKEKVEEVRNEFNNWLLEKFKGKLFLALDCLDFPAEDVASDKFAGHWSKVGEKRDRQKLRKFDRQLAKFMQPCDAHDPCKVCHRDDEKNLERLNPKEADSPLACKTCRDMFRLGGQLLRVEGIVRSHRQSIPGALDKVSFGVGSKPVYYHLFKRWETAIEVQKDDTLFLVNDWTVARYRNNNVAPLLLGNYGQRSPNKPDKPDENRDFISAGEMVEEAKKAGAIPRVGYLQMDVDRLGAIIHGGLRENHTLPRLAGLSRQLSYFFKVYLNSLAKRRLDNLPQEVKILTQRRRKNLLFIYAGGDDLFVSGAWNELVEFAFDVYQCFRAYTGYHPDITLSGGINIAGTKYPLYQAADRAKKAEKAAKEDNQRDSLSLFYQVFKWDEWLGSNNSSDFIRGVLPLVSHLQDRRLELNLARNFVRNLLITAQIQEQMIEERKGKIQDIKKKQDSLKKDEEKNLARLEQEQEDIRYYLHLPKIAYALARLQEQAKHSDLGLVRKSLLNTTNAPYFRAIATWIELLNRSN